MEEALNGFELFWLRSIASQDLQYPAYNRAMLSLLQKELIQIRSGKTTITEKGQKALSEFLAQWPCLVPETPTPATDSEENGPR